MSSQPSNTHPLVLGTLWRMAIKASAPSMAVSPRRMAQAPSDWRSTPTAISRSPWRWSRGHREGVLPAAIVSGVLLLACFGLYRFIRGVDRETRRR